MKITINTNSAILNETCNTIHGCVTSIDESLMSNHDLARMVESIDTASHMEGPAYIVDYACNGEERIATLEIDDEAIEMFLPVCIKTAKLIAPFWELGKAAVKTFNAVKDSFVAIFEEYCDEFTTRFDRPSKYCVTRLTVKDFNVDAVVLFEDDGFGNIIMRTYRNHGSDCKGELLNDLFMNRMKSHEYNYTFEEGVSEAYNAYDKLNAEVSEERRNANN